jgi:hypothetical protein
MFPGLSSVHPRLFAALRLLLALSVLSALSYGVYVFTRPAKAPVVVKQVQTQPVSIPQQDPLPPPPAETVERWPMEHPPASPAPKAQPVASKKTVAGTVKPAKAKNGKPVKRVIKRETQDARHFGFVWPGDSPEPLRRSSIKDARR